jgi:hypothetical protein
MATAHDSMVPHIGRNRVQTGRLLGAYDEVVSGTEGGPMAETSTSPNRWVLPFALLVVMLASHNELPSTTFQSGPGRGRFWQCPVCERIERMARRQPPSCEGSPTQMHARAETKPLQGGNPSPSPGPSRFI